MRRGSESDAGIFRSGLASPRIPEGQIWYSHVRAPKASRSVIKLELRDTRISKFTRCYERARARVSRELLETTNFAYQCALDTPRRLDKRLSALVPPPSSSPSIAFRVFDSPSSSLVPEGAQVRVA